LQVLLNSKRNDKAIKRLFIVNTSKSPVGLFPEAQQKGLVLTIYILLRYLSVPTVNQARSKVTRKTQFFVFCIPEKMSARAG
jgi:hypothetical protein